MITENGTIVKIKTDNIFGKGEIFVSSVNVIKKIKFVATARATNKTDEFEFSANGNEFTGEFKISKPFVWNIENPNLYNFYLAVKYEKSVEKAEGSFGFRKLQAKNGKLYLNGTPFYVKGYIRGATAHEHSNNEGLSEKEFYRKNIREAKKYGFNFVRFHSYIPNESFFDVADEEGMLVHYEFRVPESAYNNLEEMLVTNTKFAGTDKIGRLIDLFYNHPSLAEYCIGNEIKEGRSEVEKLGRFIKEKDSTRFYIDTCAWGLNNRKLIDVDVQHMGYYFPFGRHADMFDSTDNMLVCGSYDSDEVVKECVSSTITRIPVMEVPLIAHEVCHYTALRDFAALKRAFEKNGKPEPWWIDEELKMIEKKGFSDRYAEMYSASKYFQKECWKTALEAIRRSPVLSGFHFLQFADTDVYENSNGVVDCFDESNYVTSGEFLRFNGDAVLLADVGGRNFESGKDLEIPVSFSDYRTSGEDYATLVYSLTSGDGEILCCGEMKNINVSRRGLYKLCKLSLRVPRLSSAKECLLGILLQSDGKKLCENSWKLWFYPESEPIVYNELVRYKSGNSVITNDFNEAFDALEKGKNVCLVYRSEWTRHVRNKSQERPEYAFKATWNRFKPVIWDRGTNYGGLCDYELLEKFGFPAARNYDFNFSTVSEDCDKIILDDFPVKPYSIVSGTDKCTRDRFDAYKSSFNLPELQYEYTLRDFSYLFELSAGKGRLLVCGFNLTGVDNGEPSSLALARFIKSYISSDDFAPKTEITLSELKNYLRKCAEKPVKERMMTQYWELDDAPVESKEYWRESREYLEKN